MAISNNTLFELLPGYLLDITKGRIVEALSQFFKEGVVDYSGFYTQKGTTWLLQADVLHSVQGIQWEENGELVSGFNPAMIISNSCDITVDNARSINQKNALFAPILPLDEYIKDCYSAGFSDPQIETFLKVLRKQEHSNIFYLPKNPINNKEYIVRFDRIYWLPTSHIENLVNDISNSRLISLSQWGWYLFITKLSIHNCRVPETIERPED